MMLLEAPGGTVEQYENVNETLGITADSDPSAGLIPHTCAVTDDGILLADVWDSQECLDRFFKGGLRPAIAGSGMPEARPRMMPVQHTMRGAA
jgi:hypothetical protein